MAIKHLVLSGGGPAGLLTYGAARKLADNKFWDIKDIESIYGTSIGSFLGVVLSLGYHWKWLDDYFIKRPWEKLISFTTLSIIEIYNNKGFLTVDFIEKTVEPLFTAKNLAKNITMKELFEFNKIDIHIYTTEINGDRMEKVCISHESHPNLTVVNALAMSMAFPFAFTPVCVNDKCYIDGGLLNNYPLKDCIHDKKCVEDEILSFKNFWIVDECTINNDSNVFEFLMVILRKMKREIDTQQDQVDIKNTVRCLVEDLDGMQSWVDALSTEDLRKKLIERGAHQGQLFLDYYKNKDNDAK